MYGNVIVLVKCRVYKEYRLRGELVQRCVKKIIRSFCVMTKNMCISDILNKSTNVNILNQIPFVYSHSRAIDKQLLTNNILGIHV